MPKLRTIKLPSSYELREYLRKASTEMEIAEISVERMAVDFIARCRLERKEARIHARNERKKNSQAQTGNVWTCPYILTYRMYGRHLDLYWTKIIVHKDSRKKSFRRVNMPNGKTKMTAITLNAAKEEIPVLLAHEEEARKLRDLWSVYIEARRVVSFMYQNLSDAPWPPALNVGESTGMN